MIGLLSCAPPLSPRLAHMASAFSRRSRRAEKVMNGSIDERVLAITHLPFRPRCFGRGRRGLDQVGGQAGEIGLALQHQRQAFLVGQDVLAEGGVEAGQALVDLGQRGACPHRPRPRPGG